MSIFKEISIRIGEEVMEKWAYSDGVGELVKVPIEYDSATWTKDPVNYEDMESMFWRKFKRPDNCDWETLIGKKEDNNSISLFIPLNFNPTENKKEN